MRAADVGWVVSADGDDAAFACLDFMALRVSPSIAERSPLAQHYVRRRDHRRAAAAGRPVRTPRRRSHRSSRTTISASRWANAGRTRVQRDFREAAMIDGFERAAEAAGDRTKWATR